jgi:hypothetical protein
MGPELLRLAGRCGLGMIFLTSYPPSEGFSPGRFSGMKIEGWKDRMSVQPGPDEAGFFAREARRAGLARSERSYPARSALPS